MKHTCEYPLEAPFSKRIIELNRNVDFGIKQVLGHCNLIKYTVDTGQVIMRGIASGRIRIAVRTTQIFLSWEQL